METAKLRNIEYMALMFFVSICIGIPTFQGYFGFKLKISTFAAILGILGLIFNLAFFWAYKHKTKSGKDPVSITGRVSTMIFISLIWIVLVYLGL